MKRAACTIVSANYLPYARTLCESVKAYHPDLDLYVLLVDRVDSIREFSSSCFTLLQVEDLRIPSFMQLAFQYDILELNTNVKPAFLKWILSQGVDHLIYFDPDIYLFSTIDFIFDLLSENSIVLTPHITSPTTDPSHLLEQDFLSHGIFNLGFVAVSSSSEAHRFLDWWESRCFDLGFADLRNGLFVDQKWANLTPVLFAGLYILKHLGCNVAHWNLHERQLSNVGGTYIVNGREPLVFYHFSGVKADAKEIVSNKDRLLRSLDDQPGLRPVLDNYRKRLVVNGILEFEGYKYAFGAFSDGQTISTLARRVYSFKKTAMVEEDPFNAGSAFSLYARSNGLLGEADRSSSFSSLNYDKSDYRIRMINRVLRTLLTVLGSDRYTMLMKYLSFISILRNQQEVF